MQKDSTFRIVFAALTFFYALAVCGQNIPCGIGADILIIHRAEGDRLQIVGVASNSPAARAGLVKNQLIRAIDGTPTAGLKYSDCIKRIQGEAGTKVILEVEDWHNRRTNTVEVTREVVAEDPLAVDTSGWVDVPESQKPKSLLVASNQVVRISATDGAQALIQFTRFGTTNANYRWRFRPGPGGTISAGTGMVFENYDKRTNAFGSVELTQRGNPDDAQVKAGNFRLDWSISGSISGWLYYDPSRQKVEMLSPDLFDSNF